MHSQVCNKIMQNIEQNNAIWFLVALKRKCFLQNIHLFTLKRMVKTKILFEKHSFRFSSFSNFDISSNNSELPTNMIGTNNLYFNF